MYHSGEYIKLSKNVRNLILLKHFLETKISKKDFEDQNVA
jgi:hypothetical protein